MPETETTLIVEARDLDTDERRINRYDVQVPADEAGQRAQLAAIVRRLHPEAQLRSFDGGVASFLDSQSLVVARYDVTPTTRAGVVAAYEIGRAAQQALFVADRM